MKKRVLLSFLAFQQNLIKCEVKIHLEVILETNDIHEVSTFVSFYINCTSEGRDRQNKINFPLNINLIDNRYVFLNIV